MPSAALVQASSQPRNASVRPPCTHTFSRYSWPAAPHRAHGNLVARQRARAVGGTGGTSLGAACLCAGALSPTRHRGLTQNAPLFVFRIEARSESAPNSIASDPNSASTTTPGAPVHAGVFASPVFKLTMFFGSGGGRRRKRGRGRRRRRLDALLDVHLVAGEVVRGEPAPTAQHADGRFERRRLPSRG